MKAKFINEEMGDILKPKSKQEIDIDLEKEIKGDGKSKVYHVWSGLDAFELTVNGEKIYFPYIAVIATSELDARMKAAKILGQELWDQDTNDNYDNYVYNAEFKYNF